ncbi:MAG: secretin N-terminal domain-containing protein, partial [Gammaproteobacteria bacterium]
MSISNTKLTISVLAINVFILSCATQDEINNKKPLLDEINESLNDSIKENEILKSTEINSDEITNALIPSINLNIPNLNLDTAKNVTSQRFDIKVNKVNAKHFFMGLVDGTPMNMVLHPDIKGKITLDLKNVLVSDVMEVTQDVFGYDYVLTGNTYKIFPNIMRTRIFKVNYLNINRKGDSQMRVSSGQVTESNLNNSNSSGSSNSNSSRNNSNRTRETISGTHVSTSYKTDFWADLEKTLKALLAKKENRSVVVNGQSGIVVVRALTSELRVIDEFLKRTQSSIQRQVILETKILEVELNDSYQTGINWAALSQSANDRA